MSISFVRTTSQGNSAIESYDGQSKTLSGLNFIEATVLACASDGLSFHDLASVVRQNYPLEIESGLVASTVRNLQYRQLIKVIEEVTEQTTVIVEHEGIFVLTPLGSFLELNNKQLTKALKEALEWYGLTTVSILNVPVRIKVYA